VGTWGVTAFDNDVACDWAYSLEDARDLAPVQEAVANVLDAGESYLDADAACTALAACEVVARLTGNFGQRNAYTEVVDRWVAAHPGTVPRALAESAASAIDRVLTKPSELLDLWDEDRSGAEWHAAVENLKDRVLG
jgi:hypothetical protein